MVHSPREPLLWVFTVDVDADNFDLSIGGPKGGANLTWDGVEEGIPRLREIMQLLEGVRIPITWFVRVDDQIEDVCGDRAFLLDRFHNLWRALLDGADEVGFHPHLYRASQEGWVQETDPNRLDGQLRTSYHAMCRRGFVPVSSRIGEGFHSNEIMATLDALGMEVDSTALPGRIRKDAHRSIDWHGTPSVPYYPSRLDYRRPGSDAWALLEVPLSMVETMARYDAGPMARYVDLTFHPDILQPSLRRLLAETRIIVTIVHPVGLVKDFLAKSHGLIAFDPNAVRENINFIVREAARLGRRIDSATMRDCKRLLARSGASVADGAEPYK